VDDYIEKMRTREDLYTFRNLQDVRIQDMTLSVSNRWLSLGVSWARGTDRKTGDPVDDIPPLKFSTGLNPVFGRIRPSCRVLLVKRQDDVGPNEKPVTGYAHVDLGLSYDFTASLRAGLQVTNLFDEAYFPSADEQAVFAPGRSASLIFTFNTGG
jgi:outer membrane receptor protein involved in Fe transport